MSTPKVTIHNSETGEIVEREMNAEELEQYAIDLQRESDRAAEIAAKASARQAILDRLGITNEEAKLILS